MKRIHCLFPLLAFACLFPVSAQTVVPIARIQGTADKSPYDGQEVLTQGVVTLTLYGEGRLNGFFMQDTVAAGEPASTGIFVYGKADVREGDFVRLRAKAGEYRQRTQLSGIKELEVLRRNMPFLTSPWIFPATCLRRPILNAMRVWPCAFRTRCTWFPPTIFCRTRRWN